MKNLVCKRVVVENFFEPCVLILLMRKPSYGYELKNDLAAQCGCQVDIGNLYRSLAKLQKNGVVSKKKMPSESGPDKQVYQITAAGKKLLASWIAELEEEVKVIKKLINNYKKNYETGK
jgi:PadR family transcriptional regulator PadR